MLRLKIYNTKNLSRFSEVWINPSHIMQMSDINDAGFAKLTLVNNSIGLVDKDAHEKILNHFNPKKWHFFFRTGDKSC